MPGARLLHGCSSRNNTTREASIFMPLVSESVGAKKIWPSFGRFDVGERYRIKQEGLLDGRRGTKVPGNILHHLPHSVHRRSRRCRLENFHIDSLILLLAMVGNVAIVS
ncbi:unnamed protein product [Sphagnum balticum]